jgi:hypothetical protein
MRIMNGVISYLIMKERYDGRERERKEEGRREGKERRVLFSFPRPFFLTLLPFSFFSTQYDSPPKSEHQNHNTKKTRASSSTIS